MTETFADRSHYYTWALQIWQVLIGKAANRQEVTYRDLLRLKSYPDGSYAVIGGCLDPVIKYCQLTTCRR